MGFFRGELTFDVVFIWMAKDLINHIVGDTAKWHTPTFRVTA